MAETVIFKAKFGCNVRECRVCTSRVINTIISIDGVENVNACYVGWKITVTGKIDPANIRKVVEEKTPTRMEIISWHPRGGEERKKERKEGEKKEKTNETVDVNCSYFQRQRCTKTKGDKKKGKVSDKGGEEEFNVDLKINFHCRHCASGFIKRIRMIDGVNGVKTSDGRKMRVKCTIDPERLVAKIMEKSKEKVQLISPLQVAGGSGVVVDNSEEKQECPPSGTTKCHQKAPLSRNTPNLPPDLVWDQERYRSYPFYPLAHGDDYPDGCSMM